MIKIDVEIKGLAAVQATLNNQAKQVRFAASKALNAVGKGLAKRENEEIKRLFKNPIPRPVREAYEAGIFGLLDKRPLVPGKPVMLPFSDPARELWLDFAEEIERSHGEGGKLESISDWTSKLPGAAARMAGLIELAEVGGAAESISEDAAVRGVALARALIPHAQEAFGLLGADAADGDAMAMLKWIRVEGGASFKRSTCHKAMHGRFRSVDRLIKAVERLVQRDVLREFKVPNKGAPPSVWYRVNPKCLST